MWYVIIHKPAVEFEGGHDIFYPRLFPQFGDHISKIINVWFERYQSLMFREEACYPN